MSPAATNPHISTINLIKTDSKFSTEPTHTSSTLESLPTSPLFSKLEFFSKRACDIARDAPVTARQADRNSRVSKVVQEANELFNHVEIENDFLRTRANNAFVSSSTRQLKCAFNAESCIPSSKEAVACLDLEDETDALEFIVCIEASPTADFPTLFNRDTYKSEIKLKQASTNLLQSSSTLVDLQTRRAESIVNELMMNSTILDEGFSIVVEDKSEVQENLEKVTNVVAVLEKKRNVLARAAHKIKKRILSLTSSRNMVQTSV